MRDIVLFHTPLFYFWQPLWRDEAFSFFMAKPDLLHIVINSARDFNPPLYYLLLHAWIKISGQSDMLLRIPSILAHIATVFFAVRIARDVVSFSKRWVIYIAASIAINPMLIYYAFEIRMYALYAFLATASWYFFYQKRWKWYVLFACLGLYTHSFFLLFILSLAVPRLLEKERKKNTLFLTLSPILLFLPWMPVIIKQFLRSKESWLYPVDMQMLFSSLANLVSSYDGTPSQYWKYSIVFSSIIFVYLAIGYKSKPKQSRDVLMPIFFPLAVILGYSMIRRPVFVSRYLIFVSVFETLGVCLGIAAIKNKWAKRLSAGSLLLIFLIINGVLPSYKKKTDFRSTFEEIRVRSKPDDYVYAQTPIGFLESAYYAPHSNRVFVYNPKGITIPSYIGVTVVFPDVSRTSFPPAPSRTFLVQDDATYAVIIQDNIVPSAKTR